MQNVNQNNTYIINPKLERNTHNLIYGFASGFDTIVRNRIETCIVKKLKLSDFHQGSIQRKAINQCLRLYFFYN